MYKKKCTSAYKSVKSLILASMLALSMNGAYSSNLAPVPTASNNDVKDGFSYLSNENSLKSVTNTDKAYTLVKLQEGGEKPSGEDIVTKFTYNKDTGAITPVYYQLKKSSELVIGSGDTSKYYSWQNDAERGSMLVLTDDPQKADITVKYDNNNHEIVSSDDENFVQNGSISGNFIGNKEASIFVEDKFSLKDIKGDFISNGVHEESQIVNFGTIENISGNFVDNYSHYYGGAIINQGDIKNISGNFIRNHVSYLTDAIGGGICNQGNVDNISGDFIGNFVEAKSGHKAFGGVIANNMFINKISGDFVSNYAKGDFGAGGAIYNDSGLINKISGNFVDNRAIGEQLAGGGAIGQVSSWNSYYGTSSLGMINTVSGDFINNSAVSGQGASLGGAFYNVGQVGNYDVPTSKRLPYMRQSIVNSATGEVFEVYIVMDSTLKKPLSISEIKSKVEGEGYKLLVYNSVEQIVTPEEWEQIKADAGEALQSGNYITEDIESIFSSKYFANKIGGIENSSFIGNYAKSKEGLARGGAIFTAEDLDLVAKDGYVSVITDNYVEDAEGKRPEAIYVSEKANLGIVAKANGKFVINDQINGQDGYTVNFTGDDTGVVYLNNNIKAEKVQENSAQNSSLSTRQNSVPAANVNLSNITLNLGRDNVLDGTNLNLKSGTLNMINNKVGVASLNSLSVRGNTNILADVDLAKGEMDRLTANLHKNYSGKLNVTGFNLLSDAPDNKDVTEIYFAQVGLKDKVVNGAPQAPNKYQTVAYTPIYKYNVKYDNREDAGYFLFTRGDKGAANPSDGFNPSVLAPAVAAQAGAYSTQLQTFNYAFNHVDSFMNIPYLERISMKYENRYALSSANTTDVDVFSPIYRKNNRAGIWVKPYSTFENIPLKNGPKVSNITYGTLIGYDTEIKSIKRGFDRVFTGYVGYNGASQRYSGVDSTQNGGLLGGTLTLYKGNFFNATTVSAGASVANNSNMYGNENMTMLLAGIGNKTGYNFEFKEGRFIVQPSMLMSYTFVNTFDYTNAAGVKINSDPLHALQLSPGVKLIGNLGDGWQPYVGVNMVWNLLGESKVKANDVMLPEMSIKPYVQYGIGVQKTSDRFTAYGQAMMSNGGRNGISLTGGVRWALGKEGKPIEKVQTKNDKTAKLTAPETTGTTGRKILKQLSQEQRTALGAKPQNTTRTTNIGVLKQL